MVGEVEKRTQYFSMVEDARARGASKAKNLAGKSKFKILGESEKVPKPKGYIGKGLQKS